MPEGAPLLAFFEKWEFDTSAARRFLSTVAATGSSPSPVPDEPDYNLVVALWEKACAGVPPRQMEADQDVDAFRIRRPLAHWLEEKALRLVQS